MNRRSWLWALGAGGAAGQEFGVPVQAPPYSSKVCQGKPVERCSKPVNGECPVCGTMAPPYVREIFYRYKKQHFIYSNASIENGEQGTLELLEPPHVDIACAHCSAVFRQVAEAVP